jgi:leucyl-tRNA synthetase
MEYNFSDIEPKWQKYWDDNKTFKTFEDTTKPKYYVLDMFPYPSGSGLHVGHPEGYTATDIMARFKRMKGYNVLHPMGWDSFGLPAENHAVKTGTHPNTTTQENIKTFKRQLKMLGFSYDWDREIATSNIDYYKWTQWIFVQLYNKGLAYESHMMVNWCPHLKTVLANEEVVNGKSEVGGHPVIRKPMKQWMLRITQYAERLLQDLDLLDWPESVKEMQRVWIGKSEGAIIKFKVDGSNHEIEVFTSRPDTLFGATYMVLAPEHKLVDLITTEKKKTEIAKYREVTALKSDLERTELNKDKSGANTGAFAINPANGQKVPVFIADYVLNTYGTGAIMSVPAHDERDHEFAKKFNLPIVEVVQGGNVREMAFSDDGPHVNSDFLNGMNKVDAIQKMIAWLEEKNLGMKKINYKLRDWLFSRQRYWGEPFPLIKYEDGTVRCLDVDELPVALPQVEKYEPSGTGESPLATIPEWLHFVDPKTGKKATRETNTMPQWAGSCWYYLRFCDPTNKKEPWNSKIENYWMPVDLYVGGAEHAVLHLLYSRFWHKVLFDLGLVSTKEPFHKLVNQGMILGEDGETMSKSRGNVVNPDLIVKENGADTLRLYEMFMGPLEKVKPWSNNGVKGVYNFLNRVHRFFFDMNNYCEEGTESTANVKELHKLMKKVTEDIETMHFNTGISQMMIFVNHIYKTGKVSKKTAELFALILSPYAPHLAEELWATLGHTKTLAYEKWPDYNAALAKDEMITIAVQINGKTRATFEVDADISKDHFMALIKADEKVSKYLQGTIVKEIYVPGKICNFVVKE